MSLAITPLSATSKLIIQVVLNASYSAQTEFTVALFQDTTASALAAVSQQVSLYNGAVDPNNMKINHYMTSGTTSATTFKVRAGGSAAGTVTFNGQSAARKLGGVMSSSITITEYF